MTITLHRETTRTWRILSSLGIMVKMMALPKVGHDKKYATCGGRSVAHVKHLHINFTCTDSIALEVAFNTRWSSRSDGASHLKRQSLLPSVEECAGPCKPHASCEQRSIPDSEHRESTYAKVQVLDFVTVSAEVNVLVMALGIPRWQSAL